MDLKGKKVTVVGLARSGLAACKLLLEKGAKVSATDCLDNQKIQESVRCLKASGIKDIETGRHTEKLIKGRDLIVISPGVALESPAISWAKKRAIPVIGELELAYNFCPAPIIAITGTNGKTTVSTLVGEIFRQAGRKCVVCGNIGTPFSAEVLRLISEDVVALEVSSFQLETIDRFKPKVAALLNLGIDHLDRYANFQQYLEAKSRIFLNQDQDDWSILYQDDPYKLELLAKTKARVLFFSRNRSTATGALNSNHQAAIAISSVFSIPKQVALKTCRRFKGIAHRMEEVRQISGVQFINDSKATNVDSTLWALDSITRPVILIAGGRDKGCDFTVAKEKIAKSVRAMILLGEARERIEQAFAGSVATETSAALPEAVQRAFELAQPGDCVLLSPMCASFDMFSDYAERGRTFKKAVHNLSANA
ncbi:MAG: UDP-N-acetylmuramoyl-L-alanine--D-glutamate ligase [Candidatus Omnitrophica bacterium]|nr:UDP-N-acetylmuramoyl-L-alanine--D-glutamate ligase [Candidatus Omnitrophota bacterium]